MLNVRKMFPELAGQHRKENSAVASARAERLRREASLIGEDNGALRIRKDGSYDFESESCDPDGILVTMRKNHKVSVPRVILGVKR